MAKTQESKELTAERFARFLVWLDPDRELAAAEYERLRFRLMAYFAFRKCSYADELTDETINRVALKIGVEEIQNKTAYFYGVARLVYLESLRKERRFVNIDDITVPASLPEIDAESGSSADFLDKCLQELPPDSRGLILEYFSETKRAKIDLHKNLAEKLKTSQAALRVKIMRIKQRLRLCLQECMA
ncbi:MAG: hypothetical protein ABL952_07990 [Pyrinomonadaceae bacterium]